MGGLFDANPPDDSMMAGQVLSSGLQGLVDAYKIKLGAAQAEAKTRQEGFNTAAMMPLNMAKTRQGQQRIDETGRHNTVTEAAADTSGSADIIAGGIHAGTIDPNTIPKRGAVYGKVMTALKRQQVEAGNTGPLDLVGPTNTAKQELFKSQPISQRIAASADALVPLVNDVYQSIGYTPKLDPASGKDLGGTFSGNTPLGPYPAINSLKAAAARQMGKTDFTGTEASITALSKEISNMAVSGGSDKNLELALHALNPHGSPQQIQKGLQKLTELMAGGRSQAYAGRNAFETGGSAPPPPGGKYGHLTDEQLKAALGGQ